MSDEQSPKSQAADNTLGHQTTPAAIEQAIEQIGARYITDLRILSDTFSQFYGELLASKDVRIAALDQRVEALERERSENLSVLALKNDQIAQLMRRAEDAERDRAARDAQIRAFEEIGTRYIADLQHLTSQLGSARTAETPPSESPIPETEVTEQALALGAVSAKLDSKQTKTLDKVHN